MEIAIYVAMLAVGLFLIIKGGDYFVDSSAWVAAELKIPQFIIGATIVSFATTLPEIIVSLIAAVEGNALLVAGDTAAALGQVEMAVGNGVGSVTANTGLILGISMIVAPSVLKRKDFALKAVLFVLSVIILFALSASGSYNRFLGLISFIPLAVFVADSIVSVKKDKGITVEEVREKPAVKEIIFNILRFSAGLFGIVLGAKLLVDYGTAFSRAVGVSEGVIAVTVIAVGTSLPELATMISALIKKHGSMSVGNIIGANIIDMCLIVPLSALCYGESLPVAASTLALDLPFCLGIAAVAVLPSVFTGKFARWQGVLCLAAYITYIVLRLVFIQ